MVLPPSKRQKAPKIAWTRCPSYFSIPPSATSCTHLPLQGRQKVNLISGSSKSVSFLGRGEMNGVFIINFVKFIQTRNFFRRGALQPLYRQSKRTCISTSPLNQSYYSFILLLLSLYFYLKNMSSHILMYPRCPHHLKTAVHCSLFAPTRDYILFHHLYKMIYIRNR